MKLLKIELTPPVAAISAFFLFVLSASAGTYYVSHAGASGNPGTEDSPVDTIAAALALCTSGDDEIIIEKSDMPYIADVLEVSKAVTIRSATGIPEDVVVQPTKIGGGQIFLLKKATAKLSGITISDGGGDKTGANVAISSAGGIVENCIVRNGNSKDCQSSRGSAISIAGAKGRVSNCIITNNIAGTPSAYGAIRMTAAGVVENCLIAGNYTYVDSVGPDIKGSAIYATSGKIINCTITGNRGAYSAGVHVGKDAYFYNCLIYGNIGGAGGAEGVRDIYTADDASYVSHFVNCAARVKLNETCVAVPYLSVRDAMLRPVAGSPVAGAGAEVEGAVAETDLDGNARVDAEGKIDIGCFQFSTSSAAETPAVGMIISKLATLKSAGEQISFVAHGNVDGTPEWDFGDGKTASGSEVDHVYTTCGRYSPKVTVGGVTYTAKDAVAVLPDRMYVALNNANAAYPYDTEANAATDIVTALDAAEVDGIEIVVGTGTYTSTKTPYLKHGVTLRSASGNPADVTIKASGTGVRGPMLDDAQAKVFGVTVQGGSEPTTSGYLANGIGVNVAWCGGLVSNCVVTGTSPNGRQVSTVHVLNDKGLVTHLWIYGNQIGESETICVLSVKGGGRADNCQIYNNTNKGTKWTTSGAAASVSGTGSEIRNCTIFNNKMSSCGGVIATGGIVRNCVMVNNTAKETAYKNFVVGQEARFDHCATDDAVAINESCKAGTADAFFVDYAGGDYTPKSGGLLMNTGVNPEDPEETDITGVNPRISGGTIDIGAYEADAETFDFEIIPNVKSAVVPATITYQAGLSGTNGTDEIRCYWMFDGTGKVNVESDNLASWNYTVYGSNTVSLIVSNLTEGVGVMKTAENCVEILPKTMYVVTKNEDAEWPYDTWAKATPSLNTAIDAANDGVEIVCTNGVHWTESYGTSIAKELIIRGVGGCRDDVVLKPADVSLHACTWAFSLNNEKATFRDLTLEGKGGQGCCVLRFNVNGGTATNCVIRNGCSNNHAAYGAGAYLFSANAQLTHCIVTNNTQTYDGPDNDIVVDTAGGRVSNCLIAFNRIRKSNDNGLSVVHSAGLVDNCTVVSNTVRGVGYHAIVSAGGKIANSIFANNATNGVPVCRTKGSGLVNCLTDGTEPVGEKGRVAAAADIFADLANFDWHLSSKALGVAINRGTEDFGKDLPAVDLDGNPRKVGPRVDIGCYESPIQPGLLMMVK